MARLCRRWWAGNRCCDKPRPSLWIAGSQTAQLGVPRLEDRTCGASLYGLKGTFKWDCIAMRHLHLLPRGP